MGTTFGFGTPSTYPYSPQAYGSQIPQGLHSLQFVPYQLQQLQQLEYVQQQQIQQLLQIIPQQLQQLQQVVHVVTHQLHQLQQQLGAQQPFGQGTSGLTVSPWSTVGTFGAPFQSPSVSAPFGGVQGVVM